MSPEIADTSNEGDALFFEEIVQGYVKKNPRFLRRDWLAQALDEKLREPGKRFVLLTAEPGAGKSAFIAQVAYDHPDWQRYFIRRDQRTLLGDVGVHSFLLRIGYQLAVRFPELFAQEQVKIAIEQRIGTVGEHGEVIGAEVKRILASPFYTKVLQIQQQVERNKGSVVGLRVEELVIDPRLIDQKDLQYMALINPALALFKREPDKQIVILVDALDEIRYHRSEGSLLKWLIDCPELPRNVRFVLTSRPPEGEVVTFREKKQAYIKPLTIDSKDDRVYKELKTYVEKLVRIPEVESIIKDTERKIEDFVTEAVRKADGNIGYLDAIARGIDQALSVKEKKEAEGLSLLKGLLSLKELPKDTQELYGFFLHQIKNSPSVRDRSIRVRDESTGKDHFFSMWTEVYKPVLGLLSVAFEPLSIDQIHALGGIVGSRDDVVAAKEWLLQFLDEEKDRCRFYHATMPEFLTSGETKNHFETMDLFIDAQDWHRSIVRAYRGGAQGWEKVDWGRVDDYGLRYLASHLYALREDPEYRTQLYGLPCRSLLKRKYAWYGNHVPFLRDVDLALTVARQEKPPHVLQIVRSCVLYSTFMESAPPLVIDVLARTGQLMRARTIADNISFAVDRCLAFTMLAKVHASLNDREQAGKCLEEAYRVLPSIRDTHKAMALNWIVEAAQATGLEQQARETARQALKFALTIEPAPDWWDKPNALLWAAKSLRREDDQDGLPQIRQSLHDLELIPIRNLFLQTMSVAKDTLGLKQVYELFSQPDMLGDTMAVRNLSNLALALADADLQTELNHVFGLIEKLLSEGAYIGPPDSQRRYVWALALAGHFEDALKYAERIDEQEERGKALYTVIQLASANGEGAAVKRILVLAGAMSQTDHWRVLSYLAQVFLLGGEAAKASEVADRVCRQNISPSLENTLTMPLVPETPSRRKSLKKTGKRPLQIDIRSLDDERLRDEVVHNAAEGQWQEAEAKLRGILVPSFRAQALLGMARHVSAQGKQLDYWLESLIVARLAGRNTIDEVLAAGNRLVSDALGKAVWEKIQKTLAELADWRHEPLEKMGERIGVKSLGAIAQTSRLPFEKEE